MKLRCSIILCVVLIASQPNTVRAQQEQDRIIAGEHLVRLWDAVTLGKVKLSNTELKTLILKRHLSAILLPQNQPKDKWVIRKCYKVKTVFDVPDAELTGEDFAQLIAYAKDGVFERAEAVRDAVISNDPKKLETATVDLKSYLSKQADAEKEVSTKFVGALLADLEPNQKELATYVQDYRAFVESNTRERLRFATLLLPRQLYVINKDVFDADDLSKINPSTVQQLLVADKLFRAAWVGGTYLVALQDSSPTPRDPTGLGLSTQWINFADGSTSSRPPYALRFSMRIEF